MKTVTFDLWIAAKDLETSKPDVIYRLAETRTELWEAIEEEETMGTGVTRDDLKRRGYRAHRVVVAVEPRQKVRR